DGVELEQRPRVWLRGEDVEGGGRDLARTQGLEQRGLVEQLAAGGVDHADAVLHLRKRPLADGATRLVCQRQVEGQEVGGLPYFSGRLHALGAEFAEALLRDERVVG